MNLLHSTLDYLRKRQPPLVRYFHIIILCMVLSQLIVSNFMGFTDSGEISNKAGQFFATWLHIITGLSLLPIALLFIYLELKRHGQRYFFPYLYGDVRQLTQDLRQLKSRQLPDPNPHGIATIVQGLGLGALALVLVSGLTWFVAWRYHVTWSGIVKEVHEALTGLVVAYVAGHGGMGAVHLFIHWKDQ